MNKSILAKVQVEFHSEMQKVFELTYQGLCRRRCLVQKPIADSVVKDPEQYLNNV